jgi:glycosyltransferase involved in cell wall biosynthesis
MKVVRIIARLNIGGPAIHVVLLTRGLRQRGHESHLLAGPVPDNEGDMEYFAALYDVPVTHISELVRPLSPWNDLLAFCKIYRFLRREKPDIVHTHTSKAGTLGRSAAILAGIPTIFHTFHGSVFDGYFSPARTRLFLTIERILARFTDRLITVSNSLREQLSEVYRIAPSEKVEVVRLGFDLQDFCKIAQSDVRWTTEASRKPLVIGWVGRFTEIKDPLLFVELAGALKSSGLSARFMMVGDGPLRSAVETYISGHGLSSDFILAGWQRSMPEIYSGIDMIVSTSINEGTPVTIIEAMATGCPFVAPNVGGLVDLTTGTPDNLGDFVIYSNGILVFRRNVNSLTRAVSLLASDSQLRIRMGKVGCRFALANFDQERLICEMESLYSKFSRSEAPASAPRSRFVGVTGPRI